jgi:transcriptional regulator with XRE-family HTH domain
MNNQLILLPDLRPSEVSMASTTPNEIEFRKNLDALMTAKGISGAKLERCTGIAESTLSEYLSAKTKHPNIVHAYRLARFFNVSIEELCFLRKDEWNGDEIA